MDEVLNCECWLDNMKKQHDMSQTEFRAVVDPGEDPFQEHRKLRNRNCCTRLYAYQKGRRVILLDTYIAGNTPENAGAGGIGTRSRWHCMRRRDKPWDHSNMDVQCALQIGHRLGESRSRYDSWQSHRVVGFDKQSPGEAASESGALGWERPATRGHGGWNVSTWSFLQYIWIGIQTLVGWLHPTST